jgi:plasmid maintenance system antidote protein VapI
MQDKFDVFYYTTTFLLTYRHFLNNFPSMITNKKKITQKEIAKLANIGPDFLSHIIRGRRRCPPRVALRLEEVTGINRSIWVWSTSHELRAAVEEVCRK